MIRHVSLFPSCRRELESAYASSKPDGHWFSPSTMRFFCCRIADVYKIPNKDGWAFITSEKGPSRVRCYTVRTMDASGNIGNDSAGFQGYATLGQARTGLKAYASSTPTT